MRTLILGIETSCDETAAAVVADGREILSNVVASQIELHRRYGGVFPEMASRQHVLSIVPVIRDALDQAGVGWADLSAIAVTYGPGLPGSLLVGVNAAKGIALGTGLPLIGVDHIEAHIYTNWLIAEGLPEDPPEFPLVCLIVSGGHTELVLMEGHREYRRLGGTLDDAAGEAFDKVARLLGLGYPGGPAVERAAREGDARRFEFPVAETEGAYDFSFSGLKTAVLREVQRYDAEVERPADRVPGRGEVAEMPVADLAAGFQQAVVRALVEKTVRAAEEFGAREVLLAGGVAANRALRETLREALAVPLRCPPIRLATDNATGVAALGYWMWERGEVAGLDLDVAPRLRLA